MRITIRERRRWARVRCTRIVCRFRPSEKCRIVSRAPAVRFDRLPRTRDNVVRYVLKTAENVQTNARAFLVNRTLFTIRDDDAVRTNNELLFLVFMVFRTGAREECGFFPLSSAATTPRGIIIIIIITFDDEKRETKNEKRARRHACIRNTERGQRAVESCLGRLVGQ